MESIFPRAMASNLVFVRAQRADRFVASVQEQGAPQIMFSHGEKSTRKTQDKLPQILDLVETVQLQNWYFVNLSDLKKW